jgi:hypothetical protein
MQPIDKALQAVKRLDDTPDLVDIMIGIEDYLDRNDIYAYKNWLDGELVDGPHVKPYWIKCAFKWPYRRMPDPSAGLRLIPHGTKIWFEKTKENFPQPIKKPSDYEPGTHKPKIKAEPVWVVHLLIPRRFVEDVKDEIMNLYDDKVDDMETVEDAEAEGATEEAVTTGEAGGI